MKKIWPDILKGILIGCFLASAALVIIPVVQDKIIYKKWLNDLREMQERGISPRTRGGAMSEPDTVTIDSIK